MTPPAASSSASEPIEGRLPASSRRARLIAVGSPETELVAELRALARAGDENDFVVERGPYRIAVHYSSGSSSSLTFRARYDDVARADHDAILHAGGPGAYRRSGRASAIIAVRPLAVTLRSETRSDVDAKLGGINVEYQTGDDAFDRNVYVSTPTTDEQVLGAVLGPKVRQGVLALLVLGFRHLKIDEDGAVEAFLSEFTQRQSRPGRGQNAIEAFALVLSDLPDLPVISASGGAHPEPPVWARAAPLWLVAIAAGLAGLPASCGVADAANCTEASSDGEGTTFRDGCGTPALLAFAFSIVVASGAAFVARALATPRLRGTTEAASRILHVRIAAFWLTFVATYVTASGYAFVHLRP